MSCVRFVVSTVTMPHALAEGSV